LLQRSLAAGTLSHAYLLVGPAHIGKMTLAMDLARAVNCEGGEPPCGECDSCRRITEGKHADISVTSLTAIGDEENGEDETAGKAARTKISVGQIDQILHSVSLPPFEGRCKVFILDGVEFLSIGAANRLLKTLEEPEGSVVFVLLTTNESMLPVTVVSRCQRVELRLLGTGEIETTLTSRWGVEPERARLLSRLASGCPGWAISAAGEGSLLQRRDEWLEGILGIIDSGYEERFNYAARLAGRFRRNRSEVQEQLDLWLDWWHDLLLVNVGCSDAVVNVDHLPALTDMAGRYSLAQVRAFIEDIRLASGQLRLNANPQLVLEVVMLSIPERAGAANPAAS
jgi:DNA polymerase-3 subunit delta'